MNAKLPSSSTGSAPNSDAADADGRPLLVSVDALTELQLTAVRGRERRAEILDATSRVAARGGYEAVRMRVVAHYAGVGIGTLYRYFPSKVHLLLAVLGREIDRAHEDFEAALFGVHDSFARLTKTTLQLAAFAYSNPLLTDAMARAYVVADGSAAGDAERVRNQLIDLFADLMSANQPADRDRQISEILTDVWASNALAMVHGRITDVEMNRRLSFTVHLLARNDAGRELNGSY